MPLKILPNSLTDQQLLNELEKAPEKLQELYISQFNDDVVGFCTHFDIQSGTFTVRQTLLYKLYKLWSFEPVSRETFGRRINQYILPHQKGRYWYYLLDINALKISIEAYKILQKQIRDKTKSPHYKRHFENFIKHYDIKSGTYWIESFMLYYLYDKWIYKIHKHNPMGEFQFFNFCKIYFDYKRKTSNRVMWFKVNKAISNYFTKEEYEEIRKGREKYNHDYQREKVKKETTKNNKKED